MVYYISLMHSVVFGADGDADLFGNDVRFVIPDVGIQDNWRKNLVQK